MENKKEMTTPNVSAATDTEQPFPKCTDHSIADCDENIKSFEEMQREMLRQLSPSYLKTVSMAALYDTVFDIQTPLIDGLLQRGTYLFVGSPKVGKSFMMAQLAYHISTGTPLWDYKVRKATVLYFALEDDYPRLQKRLFQMFGAEETGNLYQYILKKDIEERLSPLIERVVHEIKKGYEEYRWVGTNQRKIKIYYKDIVCIQKIKGSKYAEYITENGKYMERLSMNQILEQIHSNAFILVDRGHAVNVNHIVRVRGNVIQMVNGEEITVSRVQSSQVKEKITAYWRALR